MNKLLIKATPYFEVCLIYTVLQSLERDTVWHSSECVIHDGTTKLIRVSVYQEPLPRYPSALAAVRKKSRKSRKPSKGRSCRAYYPERGKEEHKRKVTETKNGFRILLKLFCWARQNVLNWTDLHHYCWRTHLLIPRTGCRTLGVWRGSHWKGFPPAGDLWTRFADRNSSIQRQLGTPSETQTLD